MAVSVVVAIFTAVGGPHGPSRPTTTTSHSMVAGASTTTRTSTSDAQANVMAKGLIHLCYLTSRARSVADRTEDQRLRDRLYHRAKQSEERAFEAVAVHVRKWQLRLVQHALNIIITHPSHRKCFEARVAEHADIGRLPFPAASTFDQAARVLLAARAALASVRAARGC